MAKTYMSREDALLELCEVLALLEAARDKYAPVADLSDLNCAEAGFAFLINDVIPRVEVDIKSAEDSLEADDYEYEGYGGHFRPFAGMIPRNFYQWGV